MYSSVLLTTDIAPPMGADAIRVVPVGYVPTIQPDVQLIKPIPGVKLPRVYRVAEWQDNLYTRLHQAWGLVNDLPVCQQCDSIMVVRYNRNDRSQFYGCLTYPACTATAPRYG